MISTMTASVILAAQIVSAAYTAPPPSTLKYYIQNVYTNGCTGSPSNVIQIETDKCYPRSEVCFKKAVGPFQTPQAINTCHLYSTARTHSFYKVSCYANGFKETYYSDSACTVPANAVSPPTSPLDICKALNNVSYGVSVIDKCSNVAAYQPPTYTTPAANYKTTTAGNDYKTTAAAEYTSTQSSAASTKTGSPSNGGGSNGGDTTTGGTNFKPNSASSLSLTFNALTFIGIAFALI